MSLDNNCGNSGSHRDGNGSSHKKVTTIEDIDACLGKLAENLAGFREDVATDLQRFRTDFDRRSKKTEADIVLIRRYVRQLNVRTSAVENAVLERPTPLPKDDVEDLVSLPEFATKP